MTTTRGHPSRDDLLVMAYVDGELAAEDREPFEERLASEEHLAREVAGYRRLAAVTRQCAPPEPGDHEWNRLQGDSTRRLLLWLGWALAVAGGVGFCAWTAFEVYRSDMALGGKLALGAVCSGLLLLLLIKWRDSRRLSPFDSYTDVQR
ncbi:MAG: hypothetical protein ABGY71_13680 [bacterium]|jgi:anti-sigma factor RsiW|nr:hypothetical protein [Planctomycetota bacterium]HIL52572.1 hypothetical protein [Planctomycetota bacterium]